MDKIPLWLVFASLVAVSGCEQSAEPRAGNREPILAATENSRDFGDFVLHFNAITTNRLTPEVARQYGIVRSSSRALLNVSIVRKQARTVGRSVPGRVGGAAVNLVGQPKTIAMREIREGDAVYYIGELAVANQETLIFTIEAMPEGTAESFSVRYRRQFYVD